MNSTWPGGHDIYAMTFTALSRLWANTLIATQLPFCSPWGETGEAFQLQCKIIACFILMCKYHHYCERNEVPQLSALYTVSQSSPSMPCIKFTSHTFLKLNSARVSQACTELCLWQSVKCITLRRSLFWKLASQLQFASSLTILKPRSFSLVVAFWFRLYCLLNWGR